MTEAETEAERKRSDWLERAAIMEYDANMPRKVAEDKAFKAVYGHKPTHNEKLPIWLTEEIKP